MKRCITLTMILVMSLSFAGCNSSADNHITPSSTNQAEAEIIAIPDSFNVIPEEKLSYIPEKSSLDYIIDDTLSTIGVEGVERQVYGNYMDLSSFGAQIDVFVVTDTNKALQGNLIFSNHSNEWTLSYIYNTSDNMYYFASSDVDAVVDIYDYKTGELVSAKSMTYEELSEEIKTQEEEADKQFRENLNQIAEEYGLDKPFNSTVCYEFQNCDVSVPESWLLYQQEDEVIMWVPEYDSDTAYSHIRIMVLGRRGYTPESLHSEELQTKIQHEIDNVFLTQLNNVCVISSSLEKSEKEYYQYCAEGLYQDTTEELEITLSSYAFVIGDKLFLITYQSSSKDKANYTSDVISLIDSVKPIQKLIRIVDDSVEETQPNSSDVSTSNISVRFISDTIDNDRLHLKVYTKNNSEEIFSGHVYVTFYSADGEDRLGSDTIFVESLQPGQESWANVTVDAYRGTPKMTVDFSEVTFIPLEEIESEVDLDATQKVLRSYELNFDGVSWYKDIIKVEVYSDGNCIVTIRDNPKNNGQFYANVIKQCGEQHGVTSGKVIDTSGNLKAVF